MTENIEPEPQEVDEGRAPAPTPDDEGVHDSVQPDDEPETFPRKYVEDLRQENGKWRQKAQRADDLATRLHAALVAADGRLQDPTDLPFDETHLDGDNLTTAIDELIVRKPHLKTRRVLGDVGQGETTSTSSVDLAALMRGGR
ncbi:hypothetical protein [Gordonia sp. ABSL49_1]|uniref:hypothetical protein n=1 Tax=Gordonia sp. ABSL49_1 TaxID=2920941 RepID=UPI001F10CFDB|nr:hypothetical protein [Gordonia sp. ABSL49_1]MCH5641435.1 hypothetical protein [Gordonia sp. ABSL49_1]